MKRILIIIVTVLVAIPAFCFAITPEQAKEIMGENFFGIKNVEKAFGVSFTKDQIEKLREVPFNKGTLKTCKNTHVLFPGYPLNISEVNSINRQRQIGISFYMDNFPFTFRPQKVELRWYLIRKSIVENSRGKTYNEQLKLLTNEEEVPWCCEMVYLISLNNLVKGIPLFNDENEIFRCRNITKDGKRAYIIRYSQNEFDLEVSWGTYQAGYGITSSRKLLKNP